MNRRIRECSNALKDAEMVVQSLKQAVTTATDRAEKEYLIYELELAEAELESISDGMDNLLQHV
jgi:hypothetical protein